MGDQNTRKWEGETRVELQNITPKQIWPLISDFCSINKWFPHIKTCYLVHGVPGETGMIRYCGTTESPTEDSHRWAKERLLMINSSNMCFQYDIVDNNIGFKSYVATVRLERFDGRDGGFGCRIVWSFVSDPVDGFTLEGLVGFISSCAQGMAQRMEQALLQTSDVS